MLFLLNAYYPQLIFTHESFSTSKICHSKERMLKTKEIFQVENWKYLIRSAVSFEVRFMFVTWYTNSCNCSSDNNSEEAQCTAKKIKTYF